MKKIICLILAGIAINCAKAELLEHEWKATFKVVDENGKPVAGAKISVDYSVYVKNPISGLTDTNGIFIATHHDATEDLGFRAEKLGYYSFMAAYHKGDYKPDTWNFTQIIFLKKRINPIPMYAKSVNLGMPVFDQPAGFDLTLGDWVAPYGKGISTDIIFTGHLEKRAENDTDYKLTVSFPKTGDGIQDFISPEYYLHDIGSALRSAEEAPTNGYQAEWVQTSIRRPGKPTETSKNLNHNYYFRVQTQIDHEGKIVSTHYGKIYGDFMQFRYYLNPTPNDRNMEFDPKRNLSKNLNEFERVSEP